MKEWLVLKKEHKSFLDKKYEYKKRLSKLSSNEFFALIQAITEFGKERCLI
jgi:hypothetical protein